MKKLLLIIVVVLFAAVVTNAQDAAYKAAVRKMFELAGTEATYKGAIKQMFTIFKQGKSGVPDNIWTEFELEFSKTSLNDLVDMVAPVYYKYLTVDDVQKIAEFYQTPVGKKFAASTPLITQESMQVGQEWGAKLGQIFQDKLKAKGY